MIITPDWGNYPGIRFQNTCKPDPSQPDGYHQAWWAQFKWQDDILRKFRLSGQNLEILTEASPDAGKWYRFSVVYHVRSATVDWRVVDRATGSVFHEITSVPLEISGGFNRILIGQITRPPQYGDWSDIRIDNIDIRRGAVPLN